MAAPVSPRGPSLGQLVRENSILFRLARAVAREYRDRLTARGRYLLLVLAVFALVGVDTRRSQVFVLFAFGVGVFLLGSLYVLSPRPRVRLVGRLPQRITACTPIEVRATVSNLTDRPLDDLVFSLPRSPTDRGLLKAEPSEVFLAIEPARSVDLTCRLEARRRGRYQLPGVRLAASDPLRLVASRAVSEPPQPLLVYPRFYRLDEFKVPVGRRYQPGGIPLSSHLGDSIEFVGTREYREGDPVRNIHWRSWARRGQPVVKEYQEEYFCRIALVLDTFTSSRPAKPAAIDFEAAISVLASIADYFSRSEFIVDILAAGPDVYEVSTGRSLAYLENILDVLACLEPCRDPPFARVGPHLFEKLAQITTVVAVLLDWDPARLDFLRQVTALGTTVHAIVVRQGETTDPWQHVAEDLGEIQRLTPEDVEALLAASAGPSPAARAASRG